MGAGWLIRSLHSELTLRKLGIILRKRWDRLSFVELGQLEQQFRNPTLRFRVDCPTSTRAEDRTMEWTTPTFEEIDLDCEINSYANAEL